MDSKVAVEAALFSSSDGLRVVDIATRTGLSEDTVRKALKVLDAEYDQRGSAIMVAKIGSEFRLQLRDECKDFSGRFAQMEVTRSALRTAAAIAYNQPLLQSELSRTLGSRTYDDVRELVALGLVSGKSKGQTLELSTTKKFSDYFGIEGTTKADIKKWIEKTESDPAESKKV